MHALFFEIAFPKDCEAIAEDVVDVNAIAGVTNNIAEKNFANLVINFLFPYIPKTW